jgi:hypothetical protein
VEIDATRARYVDKLRAGSAGSFVGARMLL